MLEPALVALEVSDDEERRPGAVPRRKRDNLPALDGAGKAARASRGALDDDDDDDDDDGESEGEDEEDCAASVDLAAAACSLIGQCYEALENRSRAVAWLRLALRTDARCAEALTFLVERRLLSAAEEVALRRLEI